MSSCVVSRKESGNNEGDQVPAIASAPEQRLDQELSTACKLSEEDTVQANFERRVAKFETLNEAKVVDV